MANAVNTDSLWTTISQADAFNNHLGYSLSAKLSIALFGHAERSFRLPALILGILSIYALWSVSRHLLNNSIAFVPPLLLCLSPFHVAYSTSARGYSGMIFFTTMATYFYFKLLAAPNRRDASAFIVVSVLVQPQTRSSDASYAQ